MKIVHTNDPSPLQRLSGLYLGGAYTGKTHNICTWPNPVVISFDPHSDTARKFRDVTIVEVQTWNEFEREVLPRVKNRQLSGWLGKPINTLAIDTLSVGSQRLVEELQGGRGQMRMQDYGRLLSKLTTTVIDCIDSTMLEANRESYHVLFTAHLKTVTQGEGDNQRVLGIFPAIDGQFRDLLPRLTSFAFICNQRTRTITQPNKPSMRVPEYYVHTTRPTDLHTCGDRVGGGKYKVLPAETSGTYPDLMAAWGIPESEQGIAIQAS